MQIKTKGLFLKSETSLTVSEIDPSCEKSQTLTILSKARNLRTPIVSAPLRGPSNSM